MDVWALSLLFEAYVNLNRIPEAVRISNEGNSVAKRTDASARDPFLEALLHQAIALEAKADSKSRQHGTCGRSPNLELVRVPWIRTIAWECSRAGSTPAIVRLLRGPGGRVGTDCQTCASDQVRFHRPAERRPPQRGPLTRVGEILDEAIAQGY